MYAQVEKSKDNKSRAVADSITQKKNNLKNGFGFVDNRPEAVAQTRLQGMANNRKQTNGESSLSMRITSGQNPLAVQRAVITVNEDRLVADNAQTVANKTGSSAGAFSEVEDNETIYIFAHGYHSLTAPTEIEGTSNLEPILKGGITAAELCAMMIEEGWREEHTGAIDIRACMSGAESMLPSFAELFTIELKKAGRSNIVTGYKHLSISDSEGGETAGHSTVSKMIAVALRTDPKSIKQKIFAMEVLMQFDKRDDKLAARREECNKMERFINTFGLKVMLGSKPEGSNISDEEWNVYGYYYAIANEYANLLEAIGTDFKQREDKIHHIVGGKHAKTFDPDDVVFEEEAETIADDDDLFARLALLKV